MRKIFTVVAVIALCTVLVGCGKSGNTIVGKWEYKMGTTSFVYTFNEDKTCSYDAAGTFMKCTYKTDGNKISILYDGNTESFDTTYSIKDNKLNIKDSFDNDTIYERK